MAVSNAITSYMGTVNSFSRSLKGRTGLALGGSAVSLYRIPGSEVVS